MDTNLTLNEIIINSPEELCSDYGTDYLPDEVQYNEYEDFRTQHTSLASIFHDKLQSERLSNTYVFPYIDSTADKYFKSKKECIEFRDKIIRKYYCKTEEYITPGNSKAISAEAANRYSRHIKDVFSPYIKMIEMVSRSNGSTEVCNVLKTLIDNSYENLLNEYNEELERNKDFYEIYDFEYFADCTDIEEHDYRISDDIFTLALETLFADSMEYSVPNLYDAIAEIEEDLESHADLFFGTAYKMYLSYVEQIENMLDIIGRNLPPVRDGESDYDYIAGLVTTSMVSG